MHKQLEMNITKTDQKTFNKFMLKARNKGENLTKLFSFLFFKKELFDGFSCKGIRLVN